MIKKPLSYSGHVHFGDNYFLGMALLLSGTILLGLVTLKLTGRHQYALAKNSRLHVDDDLVIKRDSLVY